MRKIAVLLTVLLVLSLGTAFAAPGEMDKPLLTTHEVVAVADAQLAAASSYEVNAKLFASMAAEGESIDLDMDFDVKYIRDPLTMKLALAMEVLDEKISGDMYLRTEGDDLAMYFLLKADGESIAMRLPLTGMSAYFGEALGSGAASAKNAYDKLTYMGEVIVNGKKCYHIEATPKLEGDQLAALNALNPMYASLGINLNDLLPSIGKMKMNLYIDAKTYQYVRMEAELGQLLADTYAAMDVPVSVGRYELVMDYKNINRVRKFDVPASVVKKASENDLGALMGGFDVGDFDEAAAIGVIGGADGPTAVIAP